ncbi:MAG: ABC transporter substrate-binding protein [Ilumatobacteraceae bacterium]
MSPRNAQRSRARRLAALATPFALVALAACGGDDDTSAAAASVAETTAGTEDASSNSEPPTTSAPTGGTTETSAGATTVADTAQPATGEPVTVGVISSYTGNFGIYGDPMELALTLSLESAGSSAGGRPIELVFEDDATDPAVAVEKATKLVEDGASVVVCCVNAGSTFAVAPILAEAGVPQITPIANPLGLEDNPNAFVAAPSVNYDAERIGTYAAETLGYSTAVVLGMDMAYGQAVAQAFTEGFTSAGGEVVSTIMPPFGTQDFGSFLAEIPDADMVFGGFAGADGIAFIQQYDQFGLKDEMPLIAHGPLITELLLQAEGPSAAGTTAGFYYSSQLDLPENDRFKAALGGAKPDLPPSHFTAGSWATGTVLLHAIEVAGADAEDGDAMRAAIASTTIDAPWGPMSFDADTGYVFGPTYVYTVVDEGGVLRHRIDATID